MVYLSVYACRLELSPLKFWKEIDIDFKQTTVIVMIIMTSFNDNSDEKLMLGVLMKFGNLSYKQIVPLLQNHYSDHSTSYFPSVFSAMGNNETRFLYLEYLITMTIIH